MNTRNHYKIINTFNNTFKNTDKLIEDKKQVLKTDPDPIIKKQQKDDYTEKLSDLISQKINNTDDLKDKIDLKNNEKTELSYKSDYKYYIKNPNI